MISDFSTTWKCSRGHHVQVHGSDIKFVHRDFGNHETEERLNEKTIEILEDHFSDAIVFKK